VTLPRPKALLILLLEQNESCAATLSSRVIYFLIGMFCTCDAANRFF